MCAPPHPLLTPAPAKMQGLGLNPQTEANPSCWLEAWGTGEPPLRASFSRMPGQSPGKHGMVVGGVVQLQVGGQMSVVWCSWRLPTPSQGAVPPPSQPAPKPPAAPSPQFPLRVLNTNRCG